MPKNKIKILSNIRDVPQVTWSRFAAQAKAMNITQAQLLDYYTRQLRGHIAENGAEAMQEIIESHLLGEDWAHIRPRFGFQDGS